MLTAYHICYTTPAGDSEEVGCCGLAELEAMLAALADEGSRVVAVVEVSKLRIIQRGAQLVN